MQAFYYTVRDFSLSLNSIFSLIIIRNDIIHSCQYTKGLVLWAAFVASGGWHTQPSALFPLFRSAHRSKTTVWN